MAGDAGDKDGFSLRCDAAYLSLVLLQVWLYVMLRALDGATGAAPLVFYAVEALAFLGVFAAMGRANGKGRTLSAETWAPFALPVALCMASAPVLACFLGCSSPIASTAAQVLGAVGLAWGYLTYFQICTGLSARRAAVFLLVSFAAVPVVRLPLDLLPLGPACLVSVICPLAFAAVAIRSGKSPTGRAAQVQQTTSGFSARPASDITALLMQAIAFGFAMGLFRLSSGGALESTTFVLVALVAKVAFPLLVLLAVVRLRDRMSMATVCQAAVALITVALVAAMNLPQMPEVKFGVFDFARYAMVVLVMLSASSLGRRQNTHDPGAALACGMGAYTAALAAGLAISRAAGLTAELSGTLALDVVCILMVVTLVAGNVGSDADARLFSDGSAEAAPAQPPDVLDAKCDEVASRYRLAPREAETMKLICRGRSKRYIAEQLGLSENTVRGYAKTLYAKLDVHSRQELLTLLGVE